MKLFTEEEFDQAKCADLLLCACTICGKQMFKTKRVVYTNKWHGKDGVYSCSGKCATALRLRSKNLQPKLEVRCEQCGILVSKTLSDIKRSKRHFCSKSCAAKYNMPLRPPPSSESNQQRSHTIKRLMAETPERFEGSRRRIQATSQYLKNPSMCPICNNNISYERRNNKTCSKTCRSLLMSKIRIQYLKSPNRKIRGHGVRSYMEITFEEWLQQHGMQKGRKGYLTEVQFHNPKTGKTGFCDFVFPKLRLIVELDGTHHLKRQHLDSLRDEHLVRRGWRVYRISIREYIQKTKVEEVSNLLRLVGETRVELV